MSATWQHPYEGYFFNAMCSRGKYHLNINFFYKGADLIMSDSLVTNIVTIHSTGVDTVTCHLASLAPAMATIWNR